MGSKLGLGMMMHLGDMLVILQSTHPLYRLTILTEEAKNILNPSCHHVPMKWGFQ